MEFSPWIIISSFPESGSSISKQVWVLCSLAQTKHKDSVEDHNKREFFLARLHTRWHPAGARWKVLYWAWQCTPSTYDFQSHIKWSLYRGLAAPIKPFLKARDRPERLFAASAGSEAPAGSGAGAPAVSRSSYSSRTSCLSRSSCLSSSSCLSRTSWNRSC